MAETAKVELKGDMTRGGVADGKMLILKALGSSGEVAIDLSGVTAFDLTLPQLLLSAHASAVSQGKRITFPGLLSTELARMAFDLGIPRPEGVDDEWPW